MKPERSTSSTATLIPVLGLFTTVSIIVGSVIGSGIFRKPSLMASQLGSPELLLAVWVLAGVFTLFGALTNAEIAGIISATGGQYVYFQKMYGNFIAYLYGWAAFTVIQSGSIASVVYVFAEYAQYFVQLPRLSPESEHLFVITIPFIGTFFPLEAIGVKAVALGLIWFHTIISYLGVRLSGLVQGVITTIKIGVLMALIGAAFMYSGGSAQHFVSAQDTPALFQSKSGIDMVLLLVAALSGAFWTYDGWNNITYIAGEIKQPQRTIPRALFIGMAVIIAVYACINLAYLYVMPISEMAQSTLVAADVARRVLGSGGGAFVSAAVMISTFGTSSATVLVCARVYFAMAKDKLFFPSAGVVSPRFRTPAVALLLQACWASVLVLSGTFDMLTHMLIFTIWIFYALGAFGVFILRKKMPDESLSTPRPYKVWGYPFVPAIFILFASGYVLLTLYNDILSYMQGTSHVINAALGLLLVAAGTPLYYFFRRKHGSSSS